MRITKDQLDQFLSSNKLKYEEVPVHTIEGAEDVVIGRLRAAQFPVHLWISAANTPSLVQNIIAMWAAGVYYNSEFSEVDASTNNYGFRLIRRAQELLDLLAAGTLALDEELMPVPNRFARGVDTEPVFTMGQVF